MRDNTLIVQQRVAHIRYDEMYVPVSYSFPFALSIPFATLHLAIISAFKFLVWSILIGKFFFSKLIFNAVTVCEERVQYNVTLSLFFSVSP